MTSPAWEFTNPDGTTYTCTFGDMAFSADGSTAVFGAPFYVPDATSNVSLVYIYAQTDHVWSQAPVAVLGNPRPGGNDNDCFGCGPIAISADGSTLLLGDTGATIDGLSSAGAAYLYKRVDGTWDTTPVATVLDPEMKALDQFAISVALSADGNEVLIGDANGYGTSGGPGAGYLYVAQPGGIWPTDPKPAVVLQAPDAQKFDYFGSEVAFAANGTDAFIENDPIITGNEPPGSYPLPGVYLFQQVDGEWPVTPIRKFVLPKGYEDFGAIGPGFAVSGDGNTLMITALSPSLAKQGP
ncbi:MAG: hypothetical protein ACRDHZ_21430, partial [Ktedonobacteraceae bacterium]